MKNKKTKKICASLLSLGLLAVTITSCNFPYTPGKEAGNYYFQHNNTQYNLSLDKDGSTNFKIGSTEYKGVYELKDNDLIIKLDDGTVIKAEYENGILHLNYEDIDMKFIRDVEYKVTFITGDNASSTSPVLVRNGEHLNIPESPTKDHYKFVGWFIDKDLKKPFDFNSTLVNENLTLYAKWEYIPTKSLITLIKTDDMFLQTEKVIVTEGEHFTLEVPNYINDTKFNGWYTNDGIQITDASGKSLNKWDGTKDLSVVAWSDNPSFIKTDDGYKVLCNAVNEKITTFTVPSYHNGEPVKQIASLSKLKNLQYLRLPSTINNIEFDAFDGLTKIKSFEVYQTDGLEESTFTSKDGILYENNGKILKKFPVASDLEEFIVPAAVTELADFSFCDYFDENDSYKETTVGKLKKVVLPKNLTRVGKFAFFNRLNLETVEFLEGSANELVFDTSVFSHVPLKDFKLPNNLSEIGDKCFENSNEHLNWGLKVGELIIPDSVKKIGSKAFWYQYNYEYNENDKLPLNKVVLGSGIEEIGNDAFNGCFGLSEVDTSKADLLTTLNSGVFSTTAITSFKFPKNLNTIGSNAFANCRDMESIVVPNTVTTIKDRAFANMSGLTSILIPSSVTKFGDHVFESCNKLPFENITLENDLKKDDCAIYDSKQERILHFNLNATSYNMPDNIISLPDKIFMGSRLESVTLSKNIQKLSNGMFQGSHLKSLVIPANIERIESKALSCSKLTSVTFEENSKLKYIGQNAFEFAKLPELALPMGLEKIDECGLYNCGPMKSLVLPDSIKVLEKGALSDIKSLENLTLPKDLESIGEEMFIGTNAIKSISISDDAKNFKIMNNAVYSKDGKTLIKFFSDKPLKEYQVSEGTESIHSSAFNNAKILNITFPSSLKKIGTYAFFNAMICSADLTSLETMDEYAFYSSNINSVTLGENLKIIPTKCFASTKITNIDLTNVNLVGEKAFDGCKSLTNVTFGDKTIVSNNSFIRSGLQKVHIHGVQTIIPENSFAYTHALNELIIDNGVEIIGKNAFNGSCLLTNLVLPESIKSIATGAFTECTIDELEINSQGAVDSLLTCTRIGESYKPTNIKTLKFKENLIVNETINEHLINKGFVKNDTPLNGYVVYDIK